MRPLAPEVTDGPRADILRCVKLHPGIHLRGVERHVGLPLGQVLYHLDRLERMGLVASLRDQGFRRYFAAREVSRQAKPVLMALRHRVPRLVVLALLEEPLLTHKDLQARVGTAGSTMSFHLQRLVEAEVLARERVDGALCYRVAEPDIARRELVLFRESFQDPAVDRFVRGELARLLGDERRVPVPS